MSDSATIVQKLWNYCNVLRDDGLSYRDYIEQLTFLLFLKMADEQTQAAVQPTRDRSRRPGLGIAGAPRRRRAGNPLPAHPGELGKQPGMLGVIFRKAQNKIQDPAKLRRLVADLIDREQWTTLDADVKGDAYEGLLEKNAEDVKGGAGQYFTPRPLIRAIVDVMRPDGIHADMRPGVRHRRLPARRLRADEVRPASTPTRSGSSGRGAARLGDRGRDRPAVRDEPLLHGIGAPESPSLITVDDCAQVHSV